MKGWMYILECSDGSYYTGSTINLERRLKEHESGNGANFTKKRLPVRMVYFEEHEKIALAFYREKAIQKWRRQKKEALIYGKENQLPELSRSYRESKSSKIEEEK